MPKKSQIHYILVILLLLFHIVDAGSLEVTTSFTMGNLCFGASTEPTDTTFQGTSYPWGINTFAKETINETLSVETGFFQDPILKNRALGLFTFNSTYFSVSGGPFFGLFNSTGSYIKPGLSSGAEVRIPGVFFLNFRSDSSIGVRMVESGDYIQEYTHISLGYYIPNAICRAIISSKKFIEKKENWEEVNYYQDYRFQSEIFKKNVPYKVTLSFGYRNTFRNFITNVSGTTSSESHLFGSVIMGTGINYMINDSLTIFIDTDASLYSFPLNALESIELAAPSFLFNATIGITLNTENLFKKESSTDIF